MRTDMAMGGLSSGRGMRMSPRTRTALRLGPHSQVIRRPASSPRTSAPAGAGEGEAPAPVLVEWHDMTPGQLIEAWSGLRAWVAWLHERYELGVEDRLPPCWALHPGLVEELWALRAWRMEIYSSGQPGLGQAARYWHSELRALVQSATTVYAAGCRTGHRGPADTSLELLREWGGTYPLAGVPQADVLAGQARGTGDWASGEAVSLWLDTGEAVAVPGSEMVTRDDASWAPASGGWVRVPGIPCSPRAPSGTSASGEGWPWTS